MGKIPIRQIDPTLKDSEQFKKFSIRNLKYLLAGKDMVQDVHRHNYFFILFLEKGSGKHSIDFQSYPVTDFSVYFLRPGQVHQLTLKKESTGFIIEFNEDFYSPREGIEKMAMRKLSNKTHRQFTKEKYNNIQFISKYLFQEYTLKEHMVHTAMQAGLDMLIIELLRSGSDAEPTLKAKNLFLQERFESFLELLEKKISTIKQVSQYATMLHLTNYQLNTATQATLGKNASEVINNYIVLES